MLKKKACTALWQAMQDPNCEELCEVGLSLGRLSFCARGARGFSFCRGIGSLLSHWILRTAKGITDEDAHR